MASYSKICPRCKCECLVEAGSCGCGYDFERAPGEQARPEIAPQNQTPAVASALAKCSLAILVFGIVISLLPAHEDMARALAHAYWTALLSSVFGFLLALAAVILGNRVLGGFALVLNLILALFLLSLLG